MKFKTTKFKNVLIFGAMVWGLFQTGRLDAQTPCTGTNAYGCGGRFNYGGDVTDVTVKNSAGTVLASYSDWVAQVQPPLRPIVVFETPVARSI